MQSKDRTLRRTVGGVESRPHNNKVAVGLEVIPGLFGLSGIGHMYAGRFGAGIVLLIGFMVVQYLALSLASFLGLGWILYTLAFLAVRAGSILIATTSVFDEKNMITSR